MKHIAVVIVNFRTADMVLDCLSSLFNEVNEAKDHGFRISVHVGDAASGDDSVDVIARGITENGWGDWAEVYDIGENGGFAYGNNHVVKARIVEKSGADFIHFLNPDTTIHPGAVRTLAQHLMTHPGAGAAGSRLENLDGSLRNYAFRFPRPWREFFRGARLPHSERWLPSADVAFAKLNITQEVDWVSGASFMVPIEVVDKIGLMDPEYFLYFEETDFMYRMRQAGFAVWHVSESRVIHLGGGATGHNKETAFIKPLSPHWLASRRRYFRLHHGRLGAALADVAFLMGDIVFRIHTRLRGRQVENPPHLWRSYLGAGQK